MRWFLLGFVVLLVWVAVRWILRATSGVSQARDQAFDALRNVVAGARGIEREPGLVVLTSGEDRLELDYSLVLKAALAHKGGGAPLELALTVVVEAASVAQTEPEQIEEERAEADDTLGRDAAQLTDGHLLRVLFGHDDEDRRDAALRAAVATLPPKKASP